MQTGRYKSDAPLPENVSEKTMDEREAMYDTYTVGEDTEWDRLVPDGIIPVGQNDEQVWLAHIGPDAIDHIDADREALQEKGPFESAEDLLEQVEWYDG